MYFRILYLAPTISQNRFTQVQYSGGNRNLAVFSPLVKLKSRVHSTFLWKICKFSPFFGLFRPNFRARAMHTRGKGSWKLDLRE